VGRLDYDSDGLLIMTNDGELAQKLTHPKFGIQKTYTVSVRGDIDIALLTLREPMILDDGAEICAVSVERLSEKTIRIIVCEGRNREIRRMCEKAKLEVRRLTRTAECGIKLGGLKTGEWRYLTPREIMLLKSAGT